MSIDAEITDVDYHPDGTATLWLLPADERRAPAGQDRLTVLDAPPGLARMIGTQIWGNDSTILVGTTRFAERIGCTRIRLLPKSPTGKRS